jgi:hypothetical protein
MSAVEALYQEVENVANARSLDIIDLLIARHPFCRRAAALKDYVLSRLRLHRMKRNRRRDSDIGVISPGCFSYIDDAGGFIFEMEHKVKSNRINYYHTDCDCGTCKIKEMTWRSK